MWMGVGGRCLTYKRESTAILNAYYILIDVQDEKKVGA